METVFIVDDNEANRVAAKEALDGAYTTYALPSAAGMFRILSKIIPDIILLDIEMPDTGGFEALTMLKADERYRDIPVIFLTSRNDAESEIRGFETGAVDFINKPFSPPVLVKRVEIHLLLEMQKRELIEQVRIIENLSITDGLTGVFNRRGFDQMIDDRRRRAALTGKPMGMLLLDVDKFKVFNDTHGHLNGDICLKVVADVVKDAAEREDGCVFRWGGEEFAVLLPGADADAAARIAERIRVNIENTLINLDGEAAHVTASIGAGTLEPNNNEGGLGAFFEALDKALYRAKNDGRNRVEFI
jgi:diguanylate cyclase (GGDEF)-like protein